MGAERKISPFWICCQEVLGYLSATLLLEGAVILLQLRVQQGQTCTSVYIRLGKLGIWVQLSLYINSHGKAVCFVYYLYII